MDIALPSIFGFIGVLFGGLITGLVELWRQVLAGRAAARIIRFEIQENVNRTIQCETHRNPGVSLSDDAWKTLRTQIAPLLPEKVFLSLATNYGAHFIVEIWIKKITVKFEEAKEQLQQWRDDILKDVILLGQVENRSRIAQFVDLLRAHPTFPPPMKSES